MLLLFTSFANAQHISLPLGGAYRPGCYVPLRIETDKPGLVQIRGQNILAIDYPATGASNIIVPFMCWQASGEQLTVQVNGQEQTLIVRPVLRDEALVLLSGDAADSEKVLPNRTHVIAKTDANIFSTSALKDSVDAIITPAGVQYERPATRGPWTAMFSDAAYDPANAWAPGRPQQQRTWILLAAIASVVGIAAIGLIRIRWVSLVAIAVGAVVSIIFAMQSPLNRPDSQMSILIDQSQQSDVWTYCTTRSSMAFEKSWSNSAALESLKLIPESPQHLSRLSPVMVCDSAGKPEKIVTHLDTNMRITWLERYRLADGATITVADSVTAPSLWKQRLYSPRPQ